MGVRRSLKMDNKKGNKKPTPSIGYMSTRVIYRKQLKFTS